MCEAREGEGRSRWGEEEGKTRALGKDGVGGGREKEMEERKRKGRGDLSLWSSVWATQESLRGRKGRKCVPPWGLGCTPRGTTPRWLLLFPTFTGIRLLPHKALGTGSPSPPLLAVWPSSSQRLLSPLQLLTLTLCAYSSFAFSVSYGLCVWVQSPPHSYPKGSQEPQGEFETVSLLLGRYSSVPDHTRLRRRSWDLPSVLSPVGAQLLRTLGPTSKILTQHPAPPFGW